jgi:RimJ/RimL family protein N-acetyltransferase/GNAT superfamily N-acetyltransferase
VFQPIRTERLAIRELRLEDGELVWERRNDPEVAKYQDWVTPFPREKADQIAIDCAEGGPVTDHWWMAAVELADSGEMIGDVSVHPENDGHTAEIGYTFASAHWRQGYAVEAVAAFVEYIFETLKVDRVWGMLHPDNRPSAMVLERVGMLFEGHTRMSYWLEGEGSDDWIYGMLREDWEAWRDRPRTPPGEVRLVEITAENLTEVLGLRTHKSQEAFVAPMARSLAQALRPGEHEGKPIEPWLRAIEADGVIAGFVMMALVEGKDPYLWRLLVDRMHQRRGIAARAMDLLEEEARAMGAEHLVLSFGEGRGSPRDFYLAQGYEPTGEVHGGETEVRKSLQPPATSLQ